MDNQAIDNVSVEKTVFIANRQLLFAYFFFFCGDRPKVCFTFWLEVFFFPG